MYYPYQLSSQYADRRNQGHKHNHEAIARERSADYINKKLLALKLGEF